jgi:hypothetical protein
MDGYIPICILEIKALNKYCNPDVSLTLNLPYYGDKVGSVKFPLLPLEDVIKFEESM